MPFSVHEFGTNTSEIAQTREVHLTFIEDFYLAGKVPFLTRVTYDLSVIATRVICIIIMINRHVSLFLLFRMQRPEWRNILPTLQTVLYQYGKHQTSLQEDVWTL